MAIYTVGYERRNGEELMQALCDQGVVALADVRERPMSRKPDFRSAALRSHCHRVGIEYQPWPSLGSTAEQRDGLKSTGDLRAFIKVFETHAHRTMRADLERLASSVQAKPTALLCYERAHDECHRSVLAKLVAEQIDATILAIL